MKQFFSTITLFVFLSNYSYSQVVNNDSLFEIFKHDVQLELQNRDHCLRLGDETMVSYYLLLNHSTVESLTKHTDDSIPTIRALIYTGLAQKNADDSVLKKIYTNHCNDTATYTSCSTCVVTTWTVEEYMKFVLDAHSKNKIRRINYEERIDKIRDKIRDKFRVIIPGERHNRIKAKAFLKVDSLVCSDSNFSIASFVLSNGTETIKSQSNLLTSEMKEIIKSRKNGGRIFIENIKVKAPDNTIRKIGGMLLVIEE